jgi:hypothetical protein
VNRELKITDPQGYSGHYERAHELISDRFSYSLSLPACCNTTPVCCEFLSQRLNTQQSTCMSQHAISDNRQLKPVFVAEPVGEA